MTTQYVLFLLTFLLWLLAVNTKRSATRTVEEEIANARVPPQGNQAPPQEQASQGDQALVNPPAMSDGEIRLNFVILDQGMTNKEQSIDTQAQAMTAQDSWRVRPHVQQNAITMASRLRDCTLMNPSMLFWSKVNEDPKDFIDEVNKILYSLGVTSIEKSC